MEEALVAIDASLGIALAPAHVHDGDRLLQLSDIAMYDAKANGRGCSVYDVTADEHTADRLVLLAELRGAIERGELCVQYQPKISTGTGTPMGVEALVRGDHPRRGRLMPDVVVPLAERSGFIRALTTFVLDTALAQRLAVAAPRFQVSVNLSARNLQQEDLPTQVREALHRHALQLVLLQLEITESFLRADAASARRLLLQLDDLGVRLAMDDFGTGMAS